MAINESGNDMPSAEKALRWIGDLDHPFYNDERNRFVWYEASAIAFQMFLFANVGTVGAMLWLGGASAFPYAGPLLLVNGLVAIVAISYAHRKYSDYRPQRRDFLSSRGLTYLVLVVFMIGGLIRAQVDAGVSGETSGSDIVGYLAGLAFGLGLPCAVLVVVKRRRDAAGNRGEF